MIEGSEKHSRLVLCYSSIMHYRKIKESLAKLLPLDLQPPSNKELSTPVTQQSHQNDFQPSAAIMENIILLPLSYQPSDTSDVSDLDVEEQYDHLPAISADKSSGKFAERVIPQFTQVERFAAAHPTVF